MVPRNELCLLYSRLFELSERAWRITLEPAIIWSLPSLLPAFALMTASTLLSPCLPVVKVWFWQARWCMPLINPLRM